MKSFLRAICVLGSIALLAGLNHAPSVRAQKEAPKTKTPTIKLSDERGTGVDVTGIPTTELEALQREKMTPAQWTTLFAVYVDRGEGADRKDQTAMLGTYRVEKDVLRFEPRFPLARCPLSCCVRRAAPAGRRRLERETARNDALHSETEDDADGRDSGVSNARRFAGESAQILPPLFRTNEP